MMLTDRILTCVNCAREFVFSCEEQAFFQEKNFEHDPKRCMTCRALRAGISIVRVETRVTCAGCGETTTVPFRPRQCRPVLCLACFQRTTRPSICEVGALAVDLASAAEGEL